MIESFYIETKGPIGLIELPMVAFDGVYKAHSTMMIGTSPELEIALYTICFLARPDSLCPVRWNIKNNKDNSSKIVNFKIQTFVSKFRGNQFLGSAFPTL